jgi:hypothetical protein
MLFALALIHHLAIANNVPLGMIAKFFRQLATWAIVEFVPKRDKQVARLLETREDVFSAYTTDHFEREFGEYFQTKAKQRLKDSERILYLLRGK